MRKLCLVFLTFMLVAACQKNNSPSDSVQIDPGTIGIPNIGGVHVSLTSDKDFSPTCDDVFISDLQDPGDKTLHDIVSTWLACSFPHYDKIKSPGIPLPLPKKLCKDCYKMLPRDIIAYSVFPELLNFLDLTNSSTQAEISRVHDYLQKYNVIITTALKGTAIETPTRQVASQKLKKIMNYYLDVYAKNNPPMSPAEFTFFSAYAMLITDWQMVIPTRWGMDLFYIGQPVRFIANPDGTFKVVGERDPFPFSIGAKEGIGPGPQYHTSMFQLVDYVE